VATHLHVFAAFAHPACKRRASETSIAKLIASHPESVSRLLPSSWVGDAGAAEALLPLVYAELGELARRLFSRERIGHTLQPTALIHEAWVKLTGNLAGIRDRHHFFVIASRAMRQVLTDHARSGRCQKRGDGRPRVTLDETLGMTNAAGLDFVDLDDSLTRLSILNPRHARVVELRVLGGLTIAETAEVLGVGHATVERDWFTARAWLRLELGRAR
jgi:RNA polymerase sigma-70 factor (ECF subfamily)